jgi:hypothetical protein
VFGRRVEQSSRREEDKELGSASASLPMADGIVDRVLEDDAKEIGRGQPPRGNIRVNRDDQAFNLPPL